MTVAHRFDTKPRPLTPTEIWQMERECASVKQKYEWRTFFEAGGIAYYEQLPPMMQMAVRSQHLGHCVDEGAEVLAGTRWRFDHGTAIPS